jgi:DNA polymerase-4
MKSTDLKGKTITIKIKYNDFTQQTRSKTLPEFVSLKNEFFPTVKALLQQEDLPKSVRLLGISITKLNTEKEVKTVSVQLKLEF